MGEDQPVLLETQDTTAIITLNRPGKLNTLNHAVLDGLQAAFDKIEEDPNTRAVVFAGAGTRAFTVGIDLNVFEGGPRDARAFVLRELTVLYDRAVRLPVPVIAAIEGYAYATGCEFTMCCDIAYAGESARFCFPDLNLGIIPAAASWLVMEKLNRMRTAELMYTCATFSAREAAEIGLITRVVPDGQALQLALDTAQKMSDKAPLAIRALKRALNRRYADDWLYSLEIEQNLFASDDFAEGVRALKERRPARFSGA